MLKRILVATGLLVLVIFLVAGLLFYRFRKSFQELGVPKMPNDLSVAKVLVGERLFSKNNILPEADLSVITDIRQNSTSFVIAGKGGAAFLSNDGKVARKIQFDDCKSDVTIIDEGFLCRGFWGADVKMFDSGGKTLWSYSPGMLGIDDATAGNLGGSHRVVVGFNGGGGVRLLDMKGKELWKQDDGNVWHVEIAESDKKAGEVILHSNARGQLTIRDAKGVVVAQYKPNIYLAHFSLTDWGGDETFNKLITTDEGSIYILTMQATTMARLPAPGGRSQNADVKGTTVNFSQDTPYYAALMRYVLWNRSVLYIYDPQNNLVYDEVIGDDCGAVHPDSRQATVEKLLIGCSNGLWEYSMLRSH